MSHRLRYAVDIVHIFSSHTTRTMKRRPFVKTPMHAVLLNFGMKNQYKFEHNRLKVGIFLHDEHYVGVDLWEHYEKVDFSRRAGMISSPQVEVVEYFISPTRCSKAHEGKMQLAE